jgi:hypothetical protein
MPARHRHQHSSERRKAFTITLESVFAFAWNRRSLDRASPYIESKKWRFDDAAQRRFGADEKLATMCQNAT